MPATKSLPKSLTISKIRNRAENLGVTPGKMKKAELIHAIQRAEGYTACFGRSNGQCTQTNCCFIKDCLKLRL